MEDRPNFCGILKISELYNGVNSRNVFRLGPGRADCTDNICCLKKSWNYRCKHLKFELRTFMALQLCTHKSLHLLPSSCRKIDVSDIRKRKKISLKASFRCELKLFSWQSVCKSNNPSSLDDILFLSVDQSSLNL